MGLALLSLVTAPLRWWSERGAILISSPLSGCLVALLLGFAGVIIGHRRRPPLRPEPLAIILLLFLCSDWLSHSYNLYQAPQIRGELLVAFLLCWFLSRAARASLLFVSPFVGVALCVYVFALTADGRPIVSDDHASFYYRLELLWRHFPEVPLYIPLWNAGIEYRDFFATGALSLFFLSLPLRLISDGLQWYTLLVAGILFILTPASMYCAARYARLTRLESALATTLSLGCSLLWYRWSLKYGTMGFVTATACAPLVLALCSRLIEAKGNLRPPSLALLFLSGSLMVVWPASLFILFPTLVALLIALPTLVRSRRFLLLALAALLLHLPWMYVFWNVAPVKHFIGGSAAPLQEHNPLIAAQSGLQRHSSMSWQLLLRPLREAATSANPLLTVFLLPSLLLLVSPARRLFLVTCLWLLFLGTLGNAYKQHLELDRMLVVLALLACLPVAAVTTRIILERRFLGAVIGSVALLAPFAASAVIGNRSIEQYTFESSTRRELRDHLRNMQIPGRVLFSGFVLHELNGSHLAPLALESGKSLIASTPFHNKWRYEDVVPTRFLEEGTAGIERYFDILNVSAVIAHEPNWKERFRADARYTETFQTGRFSVFMRTQSNPTYVFEGRAEQINIFDNGVALVPHTEQLTLKFLYHSGLSASSCNVVPVEVEKILLVGLAGCSPGTPTTIHMGSAWRRVRE